ncbi:MAG: symmetrical bis(5'-nucleosyl)-tetraphosphatase [Gammaproteobacteria bacterium]|nr:symmetrical bis(5'-nucleosyl)-tetraphosphatase [Gammaproteobacteria bacterium]
MAHYAVGDVQGCLGPLRRLLEALRFDPAADRLWLTGDLVNRGPDSLATLRLIRELGEAAVAVLGNHDLHMLAVAAGAEPAKTSDTFDDVLSAPDRETLLEWLRHRPLLHRDTALGWTLLHAGLPPQWDIDTAQARAREVETALRGPRCRELLTGMYGDEPERWSDSLAGAPRLRFIINCLTRLRFCDAAGRLALGVKGPPGAQPEGYLPWFEIPGRASAGARIVFGHWAALGTRAGPDAYGIDGGCVWDGRLVALRLDVDPPRWHLVPCAGTRG